MNTEKPREEINPEYTMAGSARRNARTVPMQILSLAMPRTGTVSTSDQCLALCYEKVKDIFSCHSLESGISSNQ